MSGPVLAKPCGYVPPAELMASKHIMVIQLTTDRVGTRRGFSPVWSNDQRLAGLISASSSSGISFIIQANPENILAG